MTDRKRSSRIMGPTALLLVATGLATSAQERARPGVDWPQFRGIEASGVADGYPLPLSWNVDSGENIRWKVSIPGLSHSSPVVWRDMVCVTTAVAQNKEEQLKVGLYGDIAPVDDATPLSWEVHCFDKTSGAKRWHAVAHNGVPRIKRHPKSTHASSTLGDRRALPHRPVWVRGAVCLRPERQAAVEEGPRRARIGILSGAVCSVGLCELTDHPRRPRHRSGRRAQGLVPGGVRRGDRARSSGERRAATTRRGARPPCTCRTNALRSSSTGSSMSAATT